MSTLAIDLIIADAGTQMRAGTRMETIREYSEIAKAKAWKFATPLVVFFDGQHYYLADGFHRLEACRLAKRASVNVDIHEGSLRDAIRYALGANQEHGLRRSNEDKRHAVEVALADKEWAKLSSRAVAELCGVSDVFVGKIRDQVQTVSTSKTETLIGKDGKEYPKTQPKQAVATPATEAKPGDEYEDVADDEPEPPPKPEPTLAERRKMSNSVMNQHNIELMREADRRMAWDPNKESHDAVHAAFRRTHAAVEGWK